MANEKDFKSLIDEQKKTTEALTQVAQNTANTGEEVGDSSKKRERSEKELAADGVRREKALERIRKAASPIGKLKGAFGKVFEIVRSYVCFKKTLRLNELQETLPEHSAG